MAPPRIPEVEVEKSVWCTQSAAAARGQDKIPSMVDIFCVHQKLHRPHALLAAACNGVMVHTRRACGALGPGGAWSACAALDVTWAAAPLMLPQSTCLLPALLSSDPIIRLAALSACMSDGSRQARLPHEG